MEEFERFINTNLHMIRSLMVSSVQDILAEASRAGLIDRALKEDIRLQLEEPGEDPRKWFHYNSWKFPIKSKGYCDLSIICFNMNSSHQTQKLARCIKNCASGIFSYQNISAHTHITTPETIFSLAATINEIVKGLPANTDADESFLVELEEHLKFLFQPKNNFLNQLFDTEEFENTINTESDFFNELQEKNRNLTDQVEALEESLADKNTSEDGLLNEIELLKARETDLVSIIRNKDNEIEKIIKTEKFYNENKINQSNQIFYEKDKAQNKGDKTLQFSDDNHEIEIQKDRIYSWDEFYSELVTLRNRIKWSEIRPANWENILSKKIIRKFRQGDITSLEEWKSYPGINFVYQKHKEIMDMQIALFWIDIQNLIKLYNPQKKKCTKCGNAKILEDFNDLESSSSRDSKENHQFCKQCVWHREIRLIE